MSESIYANHEVYYTHLRQKVIADSSCFRIIQISHHKLKRVAELRRTLVVEGFKIRGFPEICWNKSFTPLLQATRWFPLTNTNFLVYAENVIEEKKIQSVLVLLSKAKTSILLTKSNFFFLNASRVQFLLENESFSRKAFLIKNNNSIITLQKILFNIFFSLSRKPATLL